MSPNKTTSLDLFNRATLFTITLRAWGNRKKESVKKVDTDADKSRLRLTKKLIVCEELDDLTRYQLGVKDWCIARSLPAFIREGVYAVNLTAVDEFERYLTAAQREVERRYLPALERAYPRAVERARTDLGEMYDAKDYPSITTLRDMFRIEWGWVTMGVPENIPSRIRRKEEEKLVAEFQNAQAEMVTALRTGFQELIARAVDRLTVPPGEQPKVFRDTLLTNLDDFISTFAMRNFMDDKELSRLVADARKIIGTVTPERLREVPSTRRDVAEAFGKMKDKIDALVASSPSRKFSLNDDEE